MSDITRSQQDMIRCRSQSSLQEGGVGDNVGEEHRCEFPSNGRQSMSHCMCSRVHGGGGEKGEEIDAGTSRDTESRVDGETASETIHCSESEDGVAAFAATAEGGAGERRQGRGDAGKGVNARHTEVCRFGTEVEQALRKGEKKRRGKKLAELVGKEEEDDLAILEHHVQHMSPQQLERFNRIRQIMYSSRSSSVETHIYSSSQPDDHLLQDCHLLAKSAEMLKDGLSEFHEHMSPEQKQRLDKVLNESGLGPNTDITPPLSQFELEIDKVYSDLKDVDRYTRDSHLNIHFQFEDLQALLRL